MKKHIITIAILLITQISFAQIKTMKVTGTGTDTSKLSARIDGKLNISDTTVYQKGIKDKKWVIFGDSFSATPGRYYGRVDSLLGLTGTVTNAVSGNRFSHQSYILDSIIAVNPNYFKSFDIASILLGVNDFAGSFALGTVSDTAGQPTAAGYLKHMIEVILASNPSIQLYTMTPTNANGAGVSYKATNAAGWSLEDMDNTINQIASYYGVQCIDLYNLANFNLQTIPSLTSDGLHPNYQGSKILASIISNAFLHNNSNGRTPSFKLPALTSTFLPKANSTTLTNSAISDDGVGNVNIGTAGSASTINIKGNTPIVNIIPSINTSPYGLQFGATPDASILQDNLTGILHISSGRNTTWGGAISLETDKVQRMLVTDTKITSYVPLFLNSPNDNAGAFATVSPSGEVSIRTPTEARLDLSISAVDNTRDLAKPISNNTQIALDGKMPSTVNSIDFDQAIDSNNTVAKLIASNTGSPEAGTGFGGIYLPYSAAGYGFQLGYRGNRLYFRSQEAGGKLAWQRVVTNQILSDSIISKQAKGASGQTALVAGTKTITVTGVTAASTATLGFVSIGGTITSTWQYAVVCTANTVTISALTNTGTTNTSDTSTLNYSIVY